MLHFKTMKVMKPGNLKYNAKTTVPEAKSLSLVLALAIIVQMFFGCQASNTTKGGAIGAAAGSAIGGIIGHRSDNTVVGAIIGATVGGAAGALIGRQMDKQAEELQRDLEGASVERVGEGIIVTFDSGFIFDLNSFALNQSTMENLNELATVLNKYENTDLRIEGHTDSSGGDQYNQNLSEKRAEAVEDYLIAQNVKSSRLTSIGYGEKQPIADNETDDGRQINRRVEVGIFANKKMKKMAEEGAL
jgi:outer membrane protein OmpA-like peptidoglycan-associated protein